MLYGDEVFHSHMSRMVVKRKNHTYDTCDFSFLKGKSIFRPKMTSRLFFEKCKQIYFFDYGGGVVPLSLG